MDLDIRNNETGIWTIAGEPDSASILEYQEEFLELIDHLFEIVQPLYVPQKVTWVGSLFESDVPLSEAAGIHSNSITGLRGGFEESAGFTPLELEEKFADELRNDDDEIVFINLVTPKDGIIRIFQDGPRAISNREADSFAVDDVTVDPDASLEWLLSLWIECRAGPESDGEPEILVKVETNSGIWFQETRDSRRNRERLRDTLRSVADTVDAHRVHTTTALYKLEECNLTEDDILD